MPCQEEEEQRRTKDGEEENTDSDIEGGEREKVSNKKALKLIDELKFYVACGGADPEALRNLQNLRSHLLH